MTTTVHVSRTFQVDPEKNPQVLEELRLLAARGFEVLGPLDLTPVTEAAVDPPKAEARSRDERQARRLRAIEICKELKSRSGLNITAVASLIGVRPPSVWRWVQSRHGTESRLHEAPTARRLEELESLLARSRSLPKGSTALKDEARGALRERDRQPPRSRPLTDEQKLAIGVMRENGSSIRSIGEAFGVSARTVVKILGEVGG